MIGSLTYWLQKFDFALIAIIIIPFEKGTTVACMV